ncbi:TetR family transcriptional regulator [Streptomyces sp. SDr-06]|uniref:ScbR family autoregulator-binding transcription factor n=1 Tax=Streptomyces sp. SDr-06 TaxID=2267702 RepID=UPI000DE83CDA|nr:ScbR family autoregulator-binding transcription factor [Streptomyces sp. SDr-06]RCH70042.1 TetR family transcriptional regulator [Streptomyces sp. SDr-06]
MARQERALRTRDALIHSAAEAFERHGYALAKLADISAGAGVSVGALHFHFESKAAVATSVETAAATRLRRAAESAQRPGMNALQRLTGTSFALADQLRSDVVSRAGLRLSTEGVRESSLDLRREWQAFVRRELAETSHQDLLDAPVERTDMADLIVAATTGFELLSRRDPAWGAPPLLNTFWSLILPTAPRS